MSCGMCSGRSVPTRYKVTFLDGSERIYLTETEARIAATQAGGGSIERITV